MNALGVWLDGEAVSALPTTLRAAHYGDGVFRTMRRDGGRIALRAEHVAHLQADAAALAITVEPHRLDTALDQPGIPDNAVVKLCAWRGGAGRGYRPDPDATAHLGLFAYELPAYPATHWQQGVSVARLSAVLSSNPALAGIKHCNRLDQVLAAQELAAKGADEGLCRDAAGRFICGTRSNVFALAGDVLHTPPIIDCGVRGLMRGIVRATAENHGLQVKETPLDDAVLTRCDGLLLSNSLIGVWPVAHLDGAALSASARLARDVFANLAPPFVMETAVACAP